HDRRSAFPATVVVAGRDPFAIHAPRDAAQPRRARRIVPSRRYESLAVSDPRWRPACTLGLDVGCGDLAAGGGRTRRTCVAASACAAIRERCGARGRALAVE